MLLDGRVHCLGYSLHAPLPSTQLLDGASPATTCGYQESSFEKDVYYKSRDASHRGGSGDSNGDKQPNKETIQEKQKGTSGPPDYNHTGLSDLESSSDGAPSSQGENSGVKSATTSTGQSDSALGDGSGPASVEIADDGGKLQIFSCVMQC